MTQVIMETLWVEEAVMFLPIFLEQRFRNRLGLRVASRDVSDAWNYVCR